MVKLKARQSAAAVVGGGVGGV